MALPATSRAASSRGQFELRNRIDGVECINGIKRVIINARGAHKDDVPALVLQLNGYSKLLNKIVPDLKAVELSVDDSAGLPVLVLADLGGAMPHNLKGEVIDGIFSNITGAGAGPSAGDTVDADDAESIVEDYSSLFE